VIVEPGFFAHPKTLLLTKLLNGDPLSPLYVLKLWAFCQDRRSDSHVLTSELLAILCGYSGSHTNKLESALVTSGYVRRDGPLVIVVGWADINSKMYASWSNGSKGGRPKKTETDGNKRDSAQKKKGEKPRKESAEKVQKTAEILKEKTQPKPGAEKGEEGEDGFPKVRHMSNGASDVDVGTDPPDDEPEEIPIEHVFKHYRKHHPKRFRKIHDGLKEWRLINDRIEKDGFTVMELCDAIDGCHVSPHHTGQNERGEVYDSLELIMRDAKHVQQFIGYYENRSRPLFSQKTQQTMSARESFLARSSDLLSQKEEVLDVD
jgi:hypothetical protein